MIRRICTVGAALGIAAGALTGCGSSSPAKGGGHARPSHTATLDSGKALVEAADRIDQTSGYRLDARIDISVGSIPVSMRMRGVVERHGTLGALRTEEKLGGHTIDLQIRIAHQMVYLSGIPGITTMSGGRHWLSFDEAEEQRAQGFGGLQGAATSDPSQFPSYLRAVGSGVRRVGSATIRGAATTEYRATLDLDRYTRLVPASRRAAARKSIAHLEAEVGRHTLPVSVWIDGQREIRRMQLRMPACIEGHRLSMSMRMDLYDYGHVPRVTIPPASDTDNITSKLKSRLPSQQAQAGSASCQASSSGA